MKRAPIFIPLLLLVACNGFKSIKSVFRQLSPHEQFVESLKKSELLNASMTREWLNASESVFQDSIFVEIPFSESGFFQASAPDARSYRFHVKDGQVLTIKGAVKTQAEAKVFMDLFAKDEDEWDRIAFGDSTFSITHEFGSDEECVLRIQPELLVNAWYAVNISLTPVLINPVYGASNRAIGSLYGASRDKGKRSHEGVDIFAPKGTPVIAPTDGYISRVGSNTLGGKVVWMKDMKRGHSYYFAHLDSQMVRAGMQVRQGHVLGLVGNTGNAKKTPPHLHFGIYQSGSKDPLNYIRRIETAISSFPIDTGFSHKSFKILTKVAPLRFGPSKDLPVRTSLPKNTFVTVTGQNNDWYRILLPDDTQGYILKKQLVELDKGKHALIDTSSVLLSGAVTSALTVEYLEKDTAVQVLAFFRDYSFVVTKEGQTGWVRTSVHNNGRMQPSGSKLRS